MDNLGSLLTAVLTVTTIIGVALAGLQRGVVQNLRDANKDLRDRDADRDKIETELRRDLGACTSDLEALGRMVRNDAEIAALRDQIHDNHVETLAFYKAQTQLGADVLDAIRCLDLGGRNSGSTP